MYGDCFLTAMRPHFNSGLLGDHLKTLNGHINRGALASCWFKRGLSVVKRSAKRILRNEGHRLITLNERLNSNVLTSCWFKRGLSVVKRLETPCFLGLTH
jgi:hypothetical protein